MFPLLQTFQLDVKLLILKSDALMVEKSEEAELESVSRHASYKNKRLSTNVTNERAEITRSFADSLIESPAADPEHRGDRKNGSTP
jgi:hypothetical protein